jgi:hypothetical protein
VHVNSDVDCRISQVKKNKQTNKGQEERWGFEKKEVTFRQVTKEERDPTLPYGHLSLRRRRESEEKEKVKVGVPKDRLQLVNLEA